MRILYDRWIRPERGVHVHKMAKVFRDLGCEVENVALVGADGHVPVPPPGVCGWGSVSYPRSCMS